MNQNENQALKKLSKDTRKIYISLNFQTLLYT